MGLLQVIKGKTAATVFPFRSKMLKYYNCRSLGHKKMDRLRAFLRMDAPSDVLHHSTTMVLL